MNRIFEFFRTLFHHRRLLRESEARIIEVWGLNSDLQMGVRLLGNSLAYVIENQLLDKPQTNKPIRFTKRTYREVQADWEYEHNAPLKEAVTRSKLGML